MSPVRSLIRASRRLVHRLRRRGIPLVYDVRYQHSLSGVPVDPLRGDKVLGALEESGLLVPQLLSEPRPVSMLNLLRVHTAEYLQAVQEPETLTRILGVPVPASEVESTLALQRLMAGGTIQALRLAMRTGGVAVHLGGGFHHALPEAGMGFCVFNDVAVAIRRLRARGFQEPVLVVDLDLHDGNGTRQIFAADPSVYTFSIHNDHWSSGEAVASTAIALGKDVEDAPFLAALRGALPAVVESLRPGLVIYLAGTDGAAGDAIGNWRLSPAGLLERDRFVTTLVRPNGLGCPMAVLLAGGYGRRAWLPTARYLLWLASGREIEPPPEDTLALKRFRRLGRDLRAAEAVDDGLAFSLSEEDIASLLPGRSPPALFLGYFASHGVELLLEKGGVLAQLRAKGFRSLRVELDGHDAAGQTLRLLCEDGPRELLVELRAERSRSVIAGMELITIEWLLLQNPRQPFSPQRPRLPGQQHPGLGLLRDIMGWLVVVCETHGLDGLYFVAAHYHIAMQSRRLVRPLHAVDEARLRALARALAELPLPEATVAAESGRVVDGTTGVPVPWEPVATVLPVSQRLREKVSGAGYEASVLGEAGRFTFRLLPAPVAPGDRPT